MRVVEEAEQIVEESGLEALTLTALAPRLGVQAPSLYKHVEGISALRRLLRIRAKTELAGVLARATAGKSGPAAVAALAGAYRDWGREHPGRYATVIRAPDKGDDEDTEASEACLDIFKAAISSYGLGGDDEVDAIRALRAHLHGFLSLELAAGMKFPNDIDHSFDLLIGIFVGALAAWPPDPVSRAA